MNIKVWAAGQPANEAIPGAFGPLDKRVLASGILPIRLRPIEVRLRRRGRTPASKVVRFCDGNRVARIKPGPQPDNSFKPATDMHRGPRPGIAATRQRRKKSPVPKYGHRTRQSGRTAEVGGSRGRRRRERPPMDSRSNLPTPGRHLSRLFMAWPPRVFFGPIETKKNLPGRRPAPVSRETTPVENSGGKL